MNEVEYKAFLVKDAQGWGLKPEYDFDYPWNGDVEVDTTTATDWEPQGYNCGEPEVQVYVQPSGDKWGCWIELQFLGVCGGDWFSAFDPDSDGAPPWTEIFDWLESMESRISENAYDIALKSGQRGWDDDY